MKRKQRTIYINDNDWDLLKKASSLAGFGSVTRYIESESIKQAAKLIKKECK